MNAEGYIIQPYPMEKLYKAVRELFEPYQPIAHDIKHALRTAALAKQIAHAEGYDEQEAEAAGLLHDVGRTVKESTIPHAQEGAPLARKLLDAHTVFSEEAKARIVKAIEVHSDLHTEGTLNNILQDADKLDGMGAIGISRAYLSIQPDYDPQNIIPTQANYGSFQSAHELITLEIEWYDMLYTETAKTIGNPRYEFAKRFLEEFKREVAETKSR